MEKRKISNLILFTTFYAKAVYLLFFFSLVSQIATGQNVRYDTIRYAKEYHEKRIVTFSSEKMIKDKIIFLGNSLTQFGDWKKLLWDSTVINRGIAGDNTFGVLARLNDIIIREPRRLFIEIGINDISQNIPELIITQNILEIVKQVHSHSPGTQVYLTSILPTNNNVKMEYPAAYGKDKQINFVNSKLVRHAIRGNYTFIDLNSKVKDRNGELDIKYAKPDGLHLSDLGYQVWINLINGAIIHQWKTWFSPFLAIVSSGAYGIIGVIFIQNHLDIKPVISFLVQIAQLISLDIALLFFLLFAMIITIK